MDSPADPDDEWVYFIKGSMRASEYAKHLEDQKRERGMVGASNTELALALRAEQMAHFAEAHRIYNISTWLRPKQPCNQYVAAVRERQETGKSLVLIIEDQELNARLFRKLLEEENCLTVWVKDGDKGLKSARVLCPDLILTDYRGLEVVKALKEDERTRNIPTIGVTAGLGNKEKFLEAGFDAYIARPVAISQFLDTVHSLLPPAIRPAAGEYQ